MQKILFYTEREDLLDNVIKYALGLAEGNTQYQSRKILNRAVSSENVILLYHVTNTILHLAVKAFLIYYAHTLGRRRT